MRPPQGPPAPARLFRGAERTQPQRGHRLLPGAAPEHRRAGRSPGPGRAALPAAPGAAAGGGAGEGRRAGPAPLPASAAQNGRRGRSGRKPARQPGQRRAGSRGRAGDVALSSAENGGTRGRPWPPCSRARSSSSRSSGEAPSKPWPRRDPRASSWPVSRPASRCPGKGCTGGGDTGTPPHPASGWGCTTPSLRLTPN